MCYHIHKMQSGRMEIIFIEGRAANQDAINSINLALCLIFWYGLGARLDACFRCDVIISCLLIQQPIMHTKVGSSFHDEGHCEGVKDGVSLRSRRGEVGSELVAKESRRFPDMPTLPSLVSYFWGRGDVGGRMIFNYIQSSVHLTADVAATHSFVQ